MHRHLNLLGTFTFLMSTLAASITYAQKTTEPVDLFDALGKAPAATQKQNDKAPRVASRSTTPRSNLLRPKSDSSASRRRPAFASQNDLALDLIGSGASSRDTGGATKQPRVASSETRSVSVGDAVVEETPVATLPLVDEPVSPSETAEMKSIETELLELDGAENDFSEMKSEEPAQSFNGAAESDQSVVEMDSSESKDRVGAAHQSFPSDATRGNNVLVSEQLPQIHSQVTGPSKILIGREAVFRVTIENRGSAAAKQLITEVAVPEWADVIHTNATLGGVHRPGNIAGSQTLRWDMATLGAGSSQTLDVVLVPKTSQPLALGVNWRHAPVASTTVVEVQEPKLSMAISGSEEVFFGRPQTYRLAITNPGTGAADNVVVQLMPPGGGQAVSSHRIDSLGPGDSKVVDIEITAREPGELSIRAVAAADGNLRTEANQQIFCRHAELSVDWRGPERKYAGTEATYFFRVRNPGTAAADQVEFEVALPAGFEFASASDGHQYTTGSRRVTWKVGTLRPGDDYYLELRGTVNQAGHNEFRLSATNADGDAHDTQTAATEVVALADLKLDVADPKGPVAVGSEVDYEITVTNRGRNAAEAVNIAGLFSAGIEPIEAIGGDATIADGRVGFQTIGTLPAGQKVRLKIRAKALSAGTHLFRAEVVCQDLEIKLAAEETTRFFQDDRPLGADGQPLESASRESRFEAMR